jgi:uncharacterized protein YbgA (DUF1722 family)/uncharacterized protein YbbK (DUF523 family)
MKQRVWGETGLWFMSQGETGNKIPLGISSCLLGEEVRFDGGHKNNAYITQSLGIYFKFEPFCPEVEIGLGIPREPIRLVITGNEVRCVGVKDNSLDVTDKLTMIADQQHDWQQEIYGYILKKDSPSCGMERVKQYRNGSVERAGVGIYASRIMQNFPNLPVEEEGRLGDPVLRENFIQRVFIYHRWGQLVKSELSWKALTSFHAQHKLILMSHDQDLARELGRELSESSSMDIGQYAEKYISKMTNVLKIKATRGNHVNVLQHIQGYLKKHLDKEDKRELTESIEQYRQGYLPLIVPITLLRHHFLKYPDDYIEQSYYMHPHPKELMLLNSL